MDKKNYRKLLDALSEYAAGSTCLVSYVLTGSTDLKLALLKIQKELSTADNIKNKNVRKKVIDALNAVRQAIPSKQKHIDHGIAIYAGWCI